MIAYYNLTAFVSLIIDDIIHDTEDKVVFHLHNNETNEKIGRKRKATVRFDRKGVPYFIHNRNKIYLDECMRII